MEENFNQLISDIFEIEKDDWNNYKKDSIEYLVRQQVLNRPTEENMKILKSFFSEKEVQILSYRYGLEDGIKHTLQNTGDKFSLTRERIRQITTIMHRTMRNPTHLKTLFYGLNPKTVLEAMNLHPSTYTKIQKAGISNTEELEKNLQILDNKEIEEIKSKLKITTTDLPIDYLHLKPQEQRILASNNIYTIKNLIDIYKTGDFKKSLLSMKRISNRAANKIHKKMLTYIPKENIHLHDKYEEYDVYQDKIDCIKKEISAGTSLKNIKLDDLPLSNRTYYCLKRVGVENLQYLILTRENKLLKIRNFGQKSLNEVYKLLKDLNLSGISSSDMISKKETEETEENSISLFLKRVINEIYPSTFEKENKKAVVLQNSLSTQSEQQNLMFIKESLTADKFEILSMHLGLHSQEKLNFKTIAEKLSISPAEVYKRYTSALQSLRMRFERIKNNLQIKSLNEKYLPKLIEKIENDEDLKNLKIEQLLFSRGTYNILKRAEVNTLYDIIEHIKTNQLKKIRNLGIFAEMEIIDLISSIVLISEEFELE